MANPFKWFGGVMQSAAKAGINDIGSNYTNAKVLQQALTMGSDGAVGKIISNAYTSTLSDFAEEGFKGGIKTMAQNFKPNAETQRGMSVNLKNLVNHAGDAIDASTNSFLKDNADAISKGISGLSASERNALLGAASSGDYSGISGMVNDAVNRLGKTRATANVGGLEGGARGFFSKEGLSTFFTASDRYDDFGSTGARIWGERAARVGAGLVAVNGARDAIGIATGARGVFEDRKGNYDTPFVPIL